MRLALFALLALLPATASAAEVGVSTRPVRGRGPARSTQSSAAAPQAPRVERPVEDFGPGPLPPSSSAPGEYDQRDVEIRAGAPDRARETAAPELMPLFWGNVLQQKVQFLRNGQGYRVRFKLAEPKAGSWSWVAAAESRKGCEYRAVITQVSAPQAPVAGCDARMVQGNLRWTLGTGSCALKPGTDYFLRFYLLAAIGENPKSMIDAGKTTCVAWLAHMGGAASPY